MFFPTERDSRSCPIFPDSECKQQASRQLCCRRSTFRGRAGIGGLFVTGLVLGLHAGRLASAGVATRLLKQVKLAILEGIDKVEFPDKLKGGDVEALAKSSAASGRHCSCTSQDFASI